MKLWNLLQLTLAWNFNHINKQEFFAISHGDEPGSDVEQMVTNSQQLFVNVSVEKLFGTIFFTNFAKPDHNFCKDNLQKSVFDLNFTNDLFFN